MGGMALVLSYDGTDYHGFQYQPPERGRTVQGEVELAWRKLFREDVRLVPAGRTDAGVHAAGQVVSLKTEALIPAANLPRAMNNLLPRDIRVLKAERTAEDFNARRDARWKRYDYLIDNTRIQDVFCRLYRLHEPVPLAAENMRRAAEFFQGTHDFRAFAAAGATARRFVRTLYHCRVTAADGLVRIVCVGDGFLYNMVRIIAGTLISVGKGKTTPAVAAAALAEGRRAGAGMTVHPRGLTLTYVEYGARRPSEIFPDLAPNEWEEAGFRNGQGRKQG
ncbi:MAG: tRNA pseudouridine(38-40) synthase TruA [Gracilibacteraceae bacterium]|jgi:tRNA pseudouridine38-40 synthase|nr:tRNA pseudouridine(38-40) synthase TruA [Gracilibacteraceae bacterium]